MAIAALVSRAKNAGEAMEQITTYDTMASDIVARIERLDANDQAKVCCVIRYGVAGISWCVVGAFAVPGYLLLRACVCVCVCRRTCMKQDPALSFCAGHCGTYLFMAMSYLNVLSYVSRGEEYSVEYPRLL